jgi:hypothetical protein
MMRYRRKNSNACTTVRKPPYCEWTRNGSIGKPDGRQSAHVGAPPVARRPFRRCSEDEKCSRSIGADRGRSAMSDEGNLLATNNFPSKREAPLSHLVPRSKTIQMDRPSTARAQALSQPADSCRGLLLASPNCILRFWFWLWLCRSWRCRFGRNAITGPKLGALHVPDQAASS